MSSMEDIFVGKYAFYKITNNTNGWKFYVFVIFQLKILYKSLFVVTFVRVRKLLLVKLNL